MENKYDILVLGGGVAGISAAIYAKRRGKNVAIIEKMMLGGQVVSLEKIENFPSQKDIDGFSLSQMFASQVKFLNIEVVSDDILKVDFSQKEKKLIGKKSTYFADSIIIATGMMRKKLGINEDDYLGKGVSYCAVCDANFYKNRPVCVASKKGSGILSAIELSNVCSKVMLLDSENMDLYAKANKNSKIEVVSNVKINSIEGDEALNKIKSTINNVDTEIVADALFIDLGLQPSTVLFENILKLDDKGFIVVDGNMKTSIEGVFAVGDVRNGFLKQIVTACSDGAIAGQLA